MADDVHDGPPRNGDAWVATEYPGPRYHVYPLDDLKEHDFTDHTCCWCKPEIDEDGIVVHNSADGRELYEDGIRKKH